MRYTLIAALAALWIAPAFAAKTVGITVTVQSYDAAEIYATGTEDAPVAYDLTVGSGAGSLEDKTRNEIWWASNDGMSLALTDTFAEPDGVTIDYGFADYATKTKAVDAHATGRTALWFKADVTLAASPGTTSGNIVLTLTP